MRIQRFQGIPLFTAVLALLFSFGCGGEKTVSTDDGDLKIKQSGDDVEITFEGDEGQKFTAKSGGNVDIPESFASDMPLYSKATPIMAMDMGAEGQMVALQTDRDPGEVHQFYLKELESQGWEIQSQMDMGGQKMLAVVKGTRQASIMVGVADGKTQINITIIEDR